MKALIGLALAFAIGFGCRFFGIPSPAPPVILGALLVVAMTVGYLVVDRWMVGPASHEMGGASPSGLAPSATAARDGAPGSSPNPNALLDQLARVVAPALSAPALRFIALLGLCAAYLQGGLTKLTDFQGAVAEVQHFGLPFPVVAASATIATELFASMLVLTGFYRWLGALWLGVFTLMATFVANRFWEIPSPDRFMVENAFFEHLGLVGGFLLVAWFDLRNRCVPSHAG